MRYGARPRPLRGASSPKRTALRRRRPSRLRPLAILAGIVVAAILLGRYGDGVYRRIAGSGWGSPNADPVSYDSPPPPPVADGPRMDPALTLHTAQAALRIVNVHEHIQGMKSARVLLDAMDKYGVGKTLLMGSSWFTITLQESAGFTRYDEINEDILAVAKAYPSRFEAWPTINPRDDKKLEKFISLHQRGSTGLKLYVGHGFVKQSDKRYMFHTMALDDPSLLPVYQYCQDNFIPIMFHVQLDAKLGPGIADEFVAVLTKFADLKVICPHYMLSSSSPQRLREFLESFPNLYSDISYGHDDFIKSGLNRIHKDPERFRALFRDYPNRFMWGTDLVITDHPSKTAEWTEARFKTYLDMLTQKTYTSLIFPGEIKNGLALDGALLERILYKNYEAFSALRPKGTLPRHSFDWSQLGGKPEGRTPGESLPPPRK